MSCSSILCECLGCVEKRTAIALETAENIPALSKLVKKQKSINNSVNVFGPTSVLQGRFNTKIYYRSVPHFSKLSEVAGITQTAVDLLPPYVVAVLQVASTYAMRIQELLTARVENILTGNRVWIQGSKGSNGYIIFLPFLEEQLESGLCGTGDGYIYNISYSQIYRKLKAVGYGTQKASGKNYRVTHLHRHQTARQVASIQGVEKAGESLHHKSKKAVLYYLT